MKQGCSLSDMWGLPFKHLHVLIISVRAENRVSKTNLTPPLVFIEIPVSSQENEQC